MSFQFEAMNQVSKFWKKKKKKLNTTKMFKYLY